MKFFVCFAMFLLTAMLFGSGFYLALVGTAYWGWFLGVGVLSLFLSAGLAQSLAGNSEEEDESVEMGD